MAEENSADFEQNSSNPGSPGKSTSPDSSGKPRSPDIGKNSSNPGSSDLGQSSDKPKSPDIGKNSSNPGSSGKPKSPDFGQNSSNPCFSGKPTSTTDFLQNSPDTGSSGKPRGPDVGKNSSNPGSFDKPTSPAFGQNSSNTGFFGKPESPNLTSRSLCTSADSVLGRHPVDVKKYKFLEMALNEKRKLYRCGMKYFTLDKIPRCSKKKSLKQSNSEESTLETTSETSSSPQIPDFQSKLSLWCGDITALEIDAIVNAANNTLLGGGGVDGAIHRAAGNGLYDECRRLLGCHTGEAKITGGYKLPSKYVIHTVGPRGRDDDKLQECYENSLNLVVENNLRSVAFPCISTGIYGFPNDAAAHVALKTVKAFLEEHYERVDRIIFCTFMDIDHDLYSYLIPKYFTKDDADSL